MNFTKIELEEVVRVFAADAERRALMGRVLAVARDLVEHMSTADLKYVLAAASADELLRRLLMAARAVAETQQRGER
jgi:hypothetical protein